MPPTLNHRIKGDGTAYETNPASWDAADYDRNRVDHITPLCGYAERLMKDRKANSSTADEGKGKKKDDSASGEGEIAVLDLALVAASLGMYTPTYLGLTREIFRTFCLISPSAHLDTFPPLGSPTVRHDHQAQMSEHVSVRHYRAELYFSNLSSSNDTNDSSATTILR